MAATKLISVAEISQHNTPDDCWIVVDGRVWDMTEFAPDHPGGGEIIWKHAGHDASTTYSSIHAPSVLPSNLDASKLKGIVDQRTITNDWQKPPPTATTELELHDKPPLDTIINAQDFEDVARRTVSKKTWAFYSSASTDCITRDKNREYFSRIWFRPRLLRSVGHVTTRSQILGHDVGLPIFVSPAAMAKMIHPDGEKGIARGCLNDRVPQCVSTNASFPISDVVSSVPPTARHPFLFQLYVNKDRSQSEALLRHVASLGVDTVIVTIDGPVQGKREADERVKADESLSTPMSGQKAKNDRRGGGIGRIMGNYIDPSFTWDGFAWLRQHWDGKIVVKGVQTWQDARRCADEGMDGVLLSNTADAI
ncbi:L-lactate dehydrogenase (cytochrome) like protein [Teratosphaeria destructans]|uniref:L-lactate dehydrogenase (Cytochrome) like protein n=1 Tax=Teratosphaeria destructans TaxID=418781 RepID=A0A9W7SL06_9PEZI|nr:L-lactate dehydrogenase (cytochrome) like protein [Teratosphaeria destructans]